MWRGWFYGLLVLDLTVVLFSSGRGYCRTSLIQIVEDETFKARSEALVEWRQNINYYNVKYI